MNAYLFFIKILAHKEVTHVELRVFDSAITLALALVEGQAGDAVRAAGQQQRRELELRHDLARPLVQHLVHTITTLIILIRFTC